MSRRKRVLLVAGRLGQALLLLTVCACSDTPSERDESMAPAEEKGAPVTPDGTTPERAEPAPRALPCAPAPVVPDAPRVAAYTVRGRVKGIGRAPIDGARVRLLAGPTRFDAGTRPCFTLVDEVQTDASGRFTATSPPFTGAELVAVAAAGEMQRTVSTTSRDIDNLVIKLAPTRTVSVSVQCEEPLPEESEWPFIRVFWEREHIIWGSWRLALPGMTSIIDPMRPHVDLRTDFAAPPSGQQHFSRELPLPVGASRLAFHTPCGFDTRSVSIPATGPVPAVAVPLPHPESGVLELRFQGDASSNGRRVLLLLDTIDIRGAWFQEGSTTRVEQLPPGTYQLAAYPLLPYRCRRSVEIRPNEVTSVIVRDNSCFLGERVPRVR